MLDLLGSQIGLLLFWIIGVAILYAFKSKINKENQNSCLEQIFIWGFVITGICTWLATCTSIMKE